MAAPLANPKLLSLDAAVARREQLRIAGKKVVLTNGVFDLLHDGHRYSLEKASKLGDALYVAINADISVKKIKGPERPIENEQQRAHALAELPYIDTILIFQSPRLDREIRALQPDVYCKAGDYTLEKLDAAERAALHDVGAQIEFMPFLPGFSTTEIIAKIKAQGGLRHRIKF